jgi:hypothetical protein
MKNKGSKKSDKTQLRGQAPGKALRVGDSGVDNVS